MTNPPRCRDAHCEHVAIGQRNRTSHTLSLRSCADLKARQYSSEIKNMSEVSLPREMDVDVDVDVGVDVGVDVEDITHTHTNTRHKYVVSGVLSRRVCRALTATSSVPLQDMDEHVSSTHALIQELLGSNPPSSSFSFSSRHRSHLLKAALVAQDCNVTFPALDRALDSHAWDHVQVIIQRLSNMEALQPDI